MREDAMTTANKITIIRILLVPFFVVQVLCYVDDGEELHRIWALIAFATACISDGLDGYIARHYHQQSELGKVLDPLADKLLLLSGVILFSMKNEPYFARMPIWLTAAIISRDALVVLGIVVVHYACGKVRLTPRLTGKTATVFQMALLVWTLLQWDRGILQFFYLTAAVLTAISGIQYVFDGMGQLSASPSSSASGPPAKQKD